MASPQSPTASKIPSDKPADSSFLIESGELGVLEIEVTDNLSGKKINEVNIPDEFQVVTLIKKKKTIIPRPDTVVDKGDRLMGVEKTQSLKKVKDILNI